jgi:hypothetical protein
MCAILKAIFRTDVIRKNQQLEKLKNEINVETTDVACNTDPSIDCNMFLAPQSSPLGRSPNYMTMSDSASLYQQQLITQETLNQLQVMLRKYFTEQLQIIDTQFFNVFVLIQSNLRLITATTQGCRQEHLVYIASRLLYIPNFPAGIPEWSLCLLTGVIKRRFDCTYSHRPAL